MEKVEHAIFIQKIEKISAPFQTLPPAGGDNPLPHSPLDPRAAFGAQPLALFFQNPKYALLIYNWAVDCKPS